MGRNIFSNRRGYNTRAKLFSSIVNEDEMIIKRDFIKPKIFYAKDHTEFELIRNEFGGVMQRQLVSGYIKTMDLQEGDIKIHDTVEYNGKRYNIEHVRFESSNAQSEVRTRPTTKTIIKLGAVIDG